MNSRVREDEKHEMIIRKLLKNTENKRCINCGSLGPQYVCTNFSIFVCTYCSGAHRLCKSIEKCLDGFSFHLREFSHRIKSISMAKFTSGEVANLQSGGNGRAREIYFKELDFLRNPLPDSSDSLKLRNFINHVYVERRYTGDRLVPTKILDGSRDDYESRRLEIRKLGFQSLSREDKIHDRRNNERFDYHARKSDAGGYHNEKLSPNGFEPDKPTHKSYDDCERRLDERVNPEATREKAKLPFRPFAFRNCEDDGSSVRSVKEILGDDVPSLRVDLYGRTVPGIITAPGGRSEGLNHSCNGDATAPVPAVKRVSSESMFSLIDFSGDPEPLVASGAAADPFPPNSADNPVSDPFATTPASAAAPPCANASVLSLFGSDPFAVAADAKPAAEPFASVPTLKRDSDPSGFGDQGASDNSENPSWAAFDFTVNSVPPEGYPGAFLANNVTTSIPTKVFEGAAWDTSSSAGNCVWSAFGLLTPAPPELVPGTTPAPLAASFGQRLNTFLTVESQTNVSQSVMQVQMGFPPQLITPDKLQAPSSASGRVRRELPQDFFSQPSVFGKDARQDLAFSMGVGHIGAPQIPQRGHQVAAQPSRTRNPFDDDLPPAPFNMGSIQAALPQVGNPLSGVASQWSQSIPQVPSTATPAVAFGYGMHLTSTMHQQNGQSGGFGQNQAFNGFIFGGSPFYSHTAGSNPFD